MKYGFFIKCRTAALAGALLLSCGLNRVHAKIDLVTLPSRDSVQLTIYNSADLTLVRDSRVLTLAEGHNTLQFSWANTLIDPTSIDIIPRKHAADITVHDLVYPPRVKNVGVWNITSSVRGEVPMDIFYFTSGLSWRMFYMATMNDAETEMNLKGYVVVTNKSGEDYDEAQTRLVVGQVNLLDEIAALARREHPYGTPRPPPVQPRRRRQEDMMVRAAAARPMMLAAEFDSMEEPREIHKEGVSEYYLYTIEGTESIPDQWAKRLISFDTDAVPVSNLYKYEEERYGNRVMRFIHFKNDEEHNLGDTPLPEGSVKVYRHIDADSENLNYEGASSMQYIPAGEEVELQLGAVGDVLVEATLMDYASRDYLFDQDGNISGRTEEHTYQIEISNTRNVPAKLEITRNFRSQSWSILNRGDYGNYEKVDHNTVKYTLSLAAQSQKTFTYILTTHHGLRADSSR